jgi:hypothetical protein
VLIPFPANEKEKKIFTGKFTTGETLPKSKEKEEDNFFFQISTTVALLKKQKFCFF